MGTDQAGQVCPCLILCECIAASISVAVESVPYSAQVTKGASITATQGATHPGPLLTSP